MEPKVKSQKMPFLLFEFLYSKVFYTGSDNKCILVGYPAISKGHELFLPCCVKDENINVMASDLNLFFELLFDGWFIVVHKSFFNKPKS